MEQNIQLICMTRVVHDELLHSKLDYVYMIDNSMPCRYTIFIYFTVPGSSLKDWSYLQRRVSGSMLNSQRGSGKR